MNLFIFISALINGIVAVTTGSLVYLKRKNHLVNQTFAIFCFASAFWAFGSFWPIVTQSAELSLTSFRILHVGAFFLAITNFHFVCTILGITHQQKNFIRIGYAISILLLPLIGTPFFIDGVVPKEGFAFWVKPAFLYHIWIVIWLAYFAKAFYLLRAFLKKEKGVKKQQIKYIYLGEIVSFSILAINFLPAYNLSVPLYFNILLAGQITVFAYAIIRYRYLNVQLSIIGIVKKITALAISLGLGLGISYMVFFQKEKPSVLLLFPIVSLATYFLLSQFFNSQSFYQILGMKHSKDFIKAVDDFYKKKLFYSNLPELLKSVHTTFVQELKISSAEVVILNSKNHEIFGVLENFFQKSRIDFLELDEFFREGSEAALNKIRELGMFCLPLRGSERRLVGFFFLGYKPRQNNYTNEEIQTLKTAAAHLSLSLKILNYGADLQKEVTHKTQQLETQTSKLQASYKKLKGLDTEKDLFFSTTSHDLRTPLTIIKGYSDFLLSEKFGKINMKQNDFLKRVQKNVDSMLSLVNSILDMSKLEANRMDFDLQEIELLPFVQEIIKDFEVKCAEKSIKLSFENIEKLKPKIKTDADKLKRVIVNLLGNAFKFTLDKGSITLRIKCCDNNSSFIHFEVEDTGVGIPEEALKTIFEKFKQVKNSQQQQGEDSTGLGLSIVKKIIEKLGGKIWVKSEINKGSNFIFTIPVKSAPLKKLK